MKLSSDEVALYYKLMWPLQFYVNQKLNLLPDVESIEAYAEDYSFEEKFPVRNALYEKSELLDSFIAENPAQLSEDELAIVRSWKNFVAGDFYIERFLKKGAILIHADEPPQVYVVLGLTDSLKDMFQYYHRPPIRVKTVLLPFQGRIIYDGLLQTYSIFFGGGIKGNLKEIYMAAKQNRRIITTLDPTLQAIEQEQARRKPVRDWRPEVDELVKAANKLKGGKIPIQSEAFSLLKASALLAQAVVHNPDDLDALWKLNRRASRALHRLETALYRAEM
ncbi:MAG: hypothetical protein ACE5H9_17940 [Anaerolineae bacterium]